MRPALHRPHRRAAARAITAGSPGRRAVGWVVAWVVGWPVGWVVAGACHAGPAVADAIGDPGRSVSPTSLRDLEIGT